MRTTAFTTELPMSNQAEAQAYLETNFFANFPVDGADEDILKHHFDCDTQLFRVSPQWSAYFVRRWALLYRQALESARIGDDAPQTHRDAVFAQMLRDSLSQLRQWPFEQPIMGTA